MVTWNDGKLVQVTWNCHGRVEQSKRRAMVTLAHFTRSWPQGCLLQRYEADKHSLESPTLDERSVLLDLLVFRACWHYVRVGMLSVRVTVSL